ncbi:hypothetical protein NT6N_25810 [Oceaniferula spumae]|uniref:PEP-CTERM sorting domain-containing protein n=1 Tax=Oceaniferula spumae TaxID=2979115 RepID=A0AAT9FNF0_9BACT
MPGSTFRQAGNGFQDPTDNDFTRGRTNTSHVSLFDFGGSGPRSAIGIKFFSDVPLDNSFSDLDGTCDLDAIDFSAWNPGTYDLISAMGAGVFIEGGTTGEGLGTITLNVMSKPSSSGLLAVGAAAILMRRGRRN